MILYTREDRKIQCKKCSMPKLNSANNFVDRVVGSIDGYKTTFWFFLQNNASYIYFEYKLQWYKTPMVCEDTFDLLEWLITFDPQLFTSTDNVTRIFRVAVTDRNTMLPSTDFIAKCLQVQGINAEAEDITAKDVILDMENNLMICPHCNEHMATAYDWTPNYCPNCGGKLSGGNQREETL